MGKALPAPTWKEVFAELQLKQGRIHLGIPDEGILPSENDVVLLEKWVPSDLMKLARLGAFQVAVLSPEKIFPKELEPMVDWQFALMPDQNELQTYLVTDKELKKKGSAENYQYPALFLDRDGVVNVDHGYVGSVEKVELMPDVTELIAKANHHKIKVAVVTNQSGIGRGLYTMKDYKSVMDCVGRLLSYEQAHIDLTVCSPFHPSSQIPEYKWGRQFRKPRPGLVHQAAQKLQISVRDSILIGDRATDLKAAVLAGVRTAYLLNSDQSQREWSDYVDWSTKLKQDHKLTQMFEGVVVKTIAGLKEVRI